MKLNQRDKILLIGILVVLIWVLGVMFFIKPAIEAASNASKTLDAKEMELAELEAQIKKDENLPQETQEAYDEAIRTADIFYDKMGQYDAMKIVESLFEDEVNSGANPIENTTLFITEMTTTTLERYVYDPNTTNTLIDNIVDGSYLSEENVTQQAQTVGVVVDEVEVNSYVMTLDFKATTKESLLRFIEVLWSNNQRSLIITELDIKDMGDNEAETELDGSMSLSFMMLDDIMSPDEAQEQESTETTQVNAVAE